MYGRLKAVESCFVRRGPSLGAVCALCHKSLKQSEDHHPHRCRPRTVLSIVQRIAGHSQSHPHYRHDANDPPHKSRGLCARRGVVCRSLSDWFHVSLNTRSAMRRFVSRRVARWSGHRGTTRRCDESPSRISVTASRASGVRTRNVFWQRAGRSQVRPARRGPCGGAGSAHDRGGRLLRNSQRTSVGLGAGAPQS